MVVGRRFRDFGGLTNQLASLVQRAKLGPNRGQSTDGTEVVGLGGENPPIGLFGRMQGVSTINGHGRSHPRTLGDS